MSTEIQDGDRGGDDTAVETADLEVLREENQRLREQFEQARQTTYRRTAVGFLIVGLIGLGAGVLFPDARTPLVVLGGTGVFGALLTYFITPEEFLAASISDHIFDATATNGQQLVDELGLQDERVYVPVGGQTVRLYLPAHRAYSVPEATALRSLFVVTGTETERGVALQPTGQRLYEDYEQAATDPAALDAFAAQVGDAVVEQFELAKSVSTDVAPDENEVRFEVTGEACGRLAAFDQPVVSFLATALAAETESPVTVTVDDDLLQCRWEE